MPARLVPLSPGVISPIPLERPVVLLGRHPECDFPISHPRISLRHCAICQVDDRLVLRDLGSTNGSRINGYQVQEAMLVSGDEVALGPLIYRLEPVPLTSSDRAAVAPPSANEPAAVDNEDGLVPLDD